MIAIVARLFGVVLLLVPVASAAGQVLDARMHHLRWGDRREWDEFPEKAESSTLAINFDSTANAAERCIRIRHRDLRQDWVITLNGRKVATLPRDQPETVTYWAVPAGAVKDGANTLGIACAARPPATAPAAAPPGTVSDDIMIGEIVLLDVSRDVALSESKVRVTVLSEDTDAGIPCRITVTDDRGALMDLGGKSTDTQAIRPGVVYTASGKVDVLLPAGRYTIYAGRGFEYNRPSATVSVRPGETVQQEFRLRRVVATPGWVACDPHVHTFTFSRHGDATIEERLLTLAGEGIELPIATDHNLNIDFAQAARQTGTGAFLTPITGNEVTTKIGHFNVFPTARDGPLPDWRAPTWAKIAESVDKAKVGDQAVMILNHGRDIHLGFRPFDPVRHLSPTGANLDGWDLPANAMEVINSGATLSDPMQLYRDWFGLMNRGKVLTPIGASDSHDVNRYIVGQGRTYIRMKDTDPGNLVPADAVRAMCEGRVLVSYGLIADLTVNDQYGPGDLVPAAAGPNAELNVAIRVLGPEWTRAARITLFANGVAIRTAEIARRPDEDEPAGEKFAVTWKLPKPKHDVWLAVIAEGPGITGAFWPCSKPYQQTTPAWTPYVMGSSGAVRIDADSSGQFDSAFDYATRIIKDAGGNADKAIAALRAMDSDGAAGTSSALAQSTAAQVAGLLRPALGDDFEAELRQRIAGPESGTQRGCEQYFAAWREHVTAGKIAAKPGTN